MLDLLPEWLHALALVLFIDIVPAGDSAVVVGMAAAGLPAEQRRRAILWCSRSGSGCPRPCCGRRHMRRSPPRSAGRCAT